jgi:DNA-binding MarR family transcriptional regulator
MTKTKGHVRLRAWRLFIQSHAYLVEVLNRELKAAEDLPLTWYEVLLFLSRAPERRLRMTELAGSVLLSKSGLTRLVDRMVDAGLIERTTCPTDRRGVFVVLTDRGMEKFAAAAPVHLRGIEEHFMRHVTAGEAGALESALTKIVESSPRRAGGPLS